MVKVGPDIPIGAEAAPNILQNNVPPNVFAATQLSAIGAFVPQLFLLGAGAYFLAGGIRKLTGSLGLSKEK